MEHTHDSECELYSEACGCSSRLALKQQCDELAEALANLVTFCETCNFDKATTGRQLLVRDARAALAKHRQPQETPELFPGTLEKLWGLGRKG